MKVKRILDDLLTVKEYAELHNVKPNTVRQKIGRGTLDAVKVGNNYMIYRNTPYEDKRIISGKYKNWRKKNV